MSGFKKPDSASPADTVGLFLNALHQQGMRVGIDDASRLAAVFSHAQDWPREQCIRALKAVLARTDEERQIIDHMVPWLFVDAQDKAGTRPAHTFEANLTDGSPSALGAAEQATAASSPASAQPQASAVRRRRWLLGLVPIFALLVILGWRLRPSLPSGTELPSLPPSVESTPTYEDAEPEPAPPPLPPLDAICPVERPAVNALYFVPPLLIGVFLAALVAFRTRRAHRQERNVKQLAAATGPRRYRIGLPPHHELLPLDPGAVREAAFHLIAPSVLVESNRLDGTATVLATAKFAGRLNLRHQRWREHRAVMFLQDVSPHMARWPEHGRQLLLALQRQGATIIHYYMDGSPLKVSESPALEDPQSLQQALLRHDSPAVIVLSDASSIEEQQIRGDFLALLSDCIWFHPRPMELWDRGARTLARHIRLIPLSQEGLLRLGTPRAEQGSLALPERYHFPFPAGKELHLRLSSCRAALGEQGFLWLAMAAVLDWVGNLDSRLLWALRQEEFTSVPWELAERVWEVPGLRWFGDGGLVFEEEFRSALIEHLREREPQLLHRTVDWAAKLVLSDVAILERSASVALVLAKATLARLWALVPDLAKQGHRSLRSLNDEGYGSLLASGLSLAEQRAFKFKIQRSQFPGRMQRAAAISGLLVAGLCVGTIASRSTRQRLQAILKPPRPEFFFLEQPEQNPLVLSPGDTLRFCDRHAASDAFVYLKLGISSSSLIRGQQRSQDEPYIWTLTGESAPWTALRPGQDAQLGISYTLRGFEFSVTVHRPAAPEPPPPRVVTVPEREPSPAPEIKISGKRLKDGRISLSWSEEKIQQSRVTAFALSRDDEALSLPQPKTQSYVDLPPRNSSGPWRYQVFALGPADEIIGASNVLLINPAAKPKVILGAADTGGSAVTAAPTAAGGAASGAGSASASVATPKVKTEVSDPHRRSEETLSFAYDVAEKTMNTGLLDQARIQYEKLFADARQANHNLGQRRALRGLSEVAIRQKNAEQAKKAYESYLEFSKITNSVDDQLRALTGLVKTAVLKGEPNAILSAAFDLNKFALKVADIEGQIYSYSEIGHIYLDINRIHDAEHFSKLALNLTNKHEQIAGKAKTLYLLASISAKKEDSAAAEDYYRKSAYTALPNSIVEQAKSYHAVGMYQISRGENAAAQHNFEEAIGIAEKLHERKLSLVYHEALLAISPLNLTNDQIEKYLQRDIELQGIVGSELGKANALRRLGLRYEHSYGIFYGAKTYLEQAIKIYESLNMTKAAQELRAIIKSH